MTVPRIPLNDDVAMTAEDDVPRLTYLGCAFLVGCAAVLFLKAWLV